MADEADGGGAGDADRRAAVADGLREAFAALAAPEVPADARPDLHQRLIAITNAAKHDLPTAERRLAAWWAARDAAADESATGG